MTEILKLGDPEAAQLMDDLDEAMVEALAKSLKGRGIDVKDLCYIMNVVAISLVGSASGIERSTDNVYKVVSWLIETMPSAAQNLATAMEIGLADEKKN